MDNIDEKNRKKGCNKLIIVKKTIKQCPNFLIIIIDTDKKYNYNFQIEKIINLKDIKDYIQGGNKLELVSFIFGKSLYCKDQNKNWHKYKGKICTTDNTIEKILNLDED